MARVLLITGGGTGIGAASAHEAARAGYAVAINYRTHETRAAHSGPPAAVETPLASLRRR